VSVLSRRRNVGGKAPEGPYLYPVIASDMNCFLLMHGTIDALFDGISFFKLKISTGALAARALTQWIFCS
jgi:hypothetical protein